MRNTVKRVIEENELAPEHIASLKDLHSDLPDGTIRVLYDEEAPDMMDWNAYAQPYVGRSWLEVPWFFAETYFFRRVLEATGYFEPGSGEGLDPFSYQKHQALEMSRGDIRVLAQQVDKANAAGYWNPATIALFLHADLWGNQADLNLWPVNEDGRPRHTDSSAEREHVLVDDTSVVLEYLSDKLSSQVRVDVIVDNAGFELVCDLTLADYLLTTRAARSIRFHLKSHPTFVSDAMVKDVEQTIDFLITNEDDVVRRFGRRLHEHIQEGGLLLRDDPYWTSPLSGWEMPEHLRQELAGAALLVSKGDANYRRLLGDRKWEFVTPFHEIVSYFPAPLVALRTLKSEIAVGIEKDTLRRVREQDPDWLTNGRWGVIQFVCPRQRGDLDC